MKTNKQTLLSTSKLIIFLCAFCILFAHFFPGPATAGTLSLYDRDPANTGTVVTEFAAYISDRATINGVEQSIVCSPVSTLDDSIPSGSYTRGYPEDYWFQASPNTYARSTIDFTSGTISSELKYSTNIFGDSFYSRIDIYTKNLPSSYSLNGNALSYNSRFLIQIFDNSNSGLGWMFLSRQGGNYQLGVFSFNDSRSPLYNWAWINPADIPTQSDIVSYANWIVDGRSTAYYFKIGAEALSSMSSADVNTTLNFGNTNPVPVPTTIILLGCGLMGVAGVSRKQK